MSRLPGSELHCVHNWNPKARSFFPQNTTLFTYITPLNKNKVSVHQSKLNPLSNVFVPEKGNRAPLPLLKCFCVLNVLNPLANSYFPIYSKGHVLNPNAEPFTPRNVPTCIDEEDGNAYLTLNNLRMKSINKILIGHLNINSIRNKFDLLADLVKEKLDIILISETKIDTTFPTTQFEIPGYSPPHRLDRTAHGGGLLLYKRGDIPSKSLPLVSESFECVISEIIISKKKWLVFGIYNPDVQTIKKHLSALEKNLEHYLPLYDNLIIFGDFNCEMTEEAMKIFCGL